MCSGSRTNKAQLPICVNNLFGVVIFGCDTMLITLSKRVSTTGVEASSVILSGFLSLPILVLFPY